MHGQHSHHQARQSKIYGNHRIAGSYLSEDLNFGKIICIVMDNDEIRMLPGQGFPKVCLFREVGYAQLPARFTQLKEFRAVGRIDQEYPDHG